MGLFQNLTGWHALILLAVVLIFFGAAKLPRLAKSLGESARILKAEAREMRPADPEASASSEAVPTASTPEAPTASDAASPTGRADAAPEPLGVPALDTRR